VTGIALRMPAGGLRTVVRDDNPIVIEVLEPTHRPVRVETHTATMENVVSLDVRYSDRRVTLLQEFREHSLRVEPLS
jgi:hypothetical protein